MAVTTKILFPATSNSTTTDFSLSGLQLHNQDDLNVYVTKTTAGIAANNNKRILHFRQSTASNVDANHNQVNNTDGLYFPAITHTGGTETLENYQIVNNNGTVRFNSALPSGAIVFVERRTRDESGTYTAFASGSTIRAKDLNDSAEQSNFTAQEARNKAFTMEGVLFRGDQPSTNFVTSDHIVAGTIVTQNIANDSVTADKIPDDTINSEHYVDLSIDTQHIANENVTTAKLAPDAVTASKLADDAVVTDNIVNSNVTRPKIAPDAVDGTKIADNSIDSEHYVDGSIDGVHLASDVIDGTKIQDDAINSEHYATGSIDHEHLANDIIDGDNIQDDVINSEHYVAGSIDNEHYANNSITSDKLNAATVITAAEQASTTTNDTSFLTSAAADARFFNISSGDTIKDGDTFPDNDTTIATTAAINDRIIDLVEEVGGFVPIANETSFPTANPDINNGTGTLVSIQSISSTRTPNSGTVSIANGAGTGNTVSITGCGSTVLSAGFGVIVETTTNLHEYTFHRLVPKATEVTTVAGISSNVTTVATNIADINTVAADLNEATSEIDTVANSITNVNNVGNSIANVNTTAGSIANVNTTATNIANVNNVGNNISNVNAAANNESNINSAVSNASNINSAVSNATNINTVAGSISNVNTTATNISSVNTVSTNISDVNNFADLYQIHANNPTTDGGGNALAAGDLYFNTNANSLKVYTGNAWVDGVTATGNFAVVTGNTFTGDNKYNDNVKLNLGTHSDLEILHNGSNSIINEKGAGSLQIQNSGSTVLNLYSSGAALTGNLDVSSGLDVTGNITVTGNVDGRDVAADGTKLDGISSSAIANVVQDTTPQLGGDLDTNGFDINFDANKYLTFGSTSVGGQIYHTGSAFYVWNGTGTTNIHGDTVALNTKSNNQKLFRGYLNGATELYYDNVKKLETDANGIFVNGALRGDSVDLSDNKKILLGASDDLEIYHTGSASFIKDSGPGNLNIASDAFRVLNAGATENMITADENGAVSLYYDNSKKLETAANSITTQAGLQVNAHGTTAANNTFGSGMSTGARATNIFASSTSANPYYSFVGTNLKLSGTNLVKYSDDSGSNWGNIAGIVFEGANQNANSGKNPAIRFLIDQPAGNGLNYSLGSHEGSGSQVSAITSRTAAYFDTNGHLYHPDNKKVIFGNSDDLQIYHDGNHSYLNETGTGSLLIKTNGGKVGITTGGGTEIANFVNNGKCELFHQGASKFETSSAGATVTGTLTATAFSGDGSNLTGITQTTINSNANNRVITGSDTANTLEGESNLTFDGNTMSILAGTGNEKLRLIASDPYLRFVEGSTNKAYVQWNSNGWLQLSNSEDQSGIRIKDDIVFTQNNFSSEHKMWHAGNDGSGSGLDADTVDGIQASSFIRSDAADSATGDITFSGGAGAITVAGNCDIRFQNGSNWTGDTTNPAKITLHNNILYFGMGTSGCIFRESGTDRVKVTGGGHLAPCTTNTYDCGTDSLRWRNVYTQDLCLSNKAAGDNGIDGTWGDYTIVEGENDLFLKNNRSNKTFKFNLTEVK